MNDPLSSAIRSIWARSIDEDSQAVALCWAKTFVHTKETDVAANMMRIVAACVAKGDFRVRNALSADRSLTAPSDALTVADYLSHASRIILDLGELSEENRNALFELFSTKQDGVISRASTHAMERLKNGALHELKGFGYGVKGQFGLTKNDYGVNIAMGGAEQTNLVGKKIKANGYSGHVYFYKDEPANVLMVGLEQSAPVTGVMDYVIGTLWATDYQVDYDQFGQGHSIIGASDTYTAAESVYFSDPAYQVKLMADKGVLPPEKYDGMHVKVTDDSWDEIQTYYQKLFAKKEGEVKETLRQVPTTSVAREPHLIESGCFSLNYSKYLPRCLLLLASSNAETAEPLHMELLGLVEQWRKTGDVATFTEIDEKLQALLSHFEGESDYVAALSRMVKLVHIEKQTGALQSVLQVYRQSLRTSYLSVVEDYHAVRQFITMARHQSISHVEDYLIKLNAALYDLHEHAIRLGLDKDELHIDDKRSSPTANKLALQEFAACVETVNGILSQCLYGFFEEERQLLLQQLEEAAVKADKAESKSAQLQRELVSLRATMATLESENANLRRQTSALNSENAQYAADQEVWEARVDGLGRENSSLRRTLAEHESRVCIQERRLTALDGKVATLESENADLRSQTSALNSENAQYAADQEVWEVRVNELGCENSSLRRTLAELESVLTRERAEHESRMHAQETLHQQVVQRLEAEKATLQEQVRRLRVPPPPPPLSMKKTLSLSEVFNAIDAIDKQAAKLNERGHTGAGQVAQALATDLSNQTRQYITGKVNLEAYQKECAKKVKDATSVLSKHRGVKNGLINFLLAVGLGFVGYALLGGVKYAISGNFMLFGTRTRSKRCLDTVSNELEGLTKHRVTSAAG